MKRPLPILCLAILAASAPAQSPQPAPHPPATLRIGLWTLWHDKQITISPAPAATLHLCENCPAAPLTQPTLIQAANSDLTLPGNRRAAQAAPDRQSFCRYRRTGYERPGSLHGGSRVDFHAVDASVRS